MTLTHNDTVRLLTYLAAHDQRTVGEEDVAAWRDASDYGRWTPPEAWAAVRELANRAVTHRVSPPQVTELIRAWRQDDAMRQTTLDRTQARREIAEPVREALERGDPTRHLGSGVVDAIYAEHDWSPTARAAAAHNCPWCREPAGLPCSRASQRHDTHREDLRDPHPSRVALIVGCRTCGAVIGDPCPKGEHSHHEREQDAIGDLGKQRRRSLATSLRAAAAEPDWHRETDFTSPDPDHEPPPDPQDDAEPERDEVEA